MARRDRAGDGGEDAALFEIRGGNELNFIAAPDFENPPPPGATPGYQVTIQVSDGAGGIDTQAIAVTVTNVPGISQSGNNSANTLTGTDEEDTLNDQGGNDTLLGQGGNDTMLGGAGNDLLDGGTGADSMTGGAGNDSYVVDSTGDSVTEAAAAGTDLVRTSLGTYTLGANVEHLTFIGTGAFAGTGNTLANTITGGSSNDVLDGLGGNDRRVGGRGDDTYAVGSSGDTVVEQAGQGIDTVQATGRIYTLSSNVENLTFVGTGNFNGSGNGLANTVIGGNGNDDVFGGGNDVLQGGSGNDELEGQGGDDTLDGSIYMLQLYDRVLPSHSVPTLVGLTLVMLLLYAGFGLFDALRTRVMSRIGVRRPARSRVLGRSAAAAARQAGR